MWHERVTRGQGCEQKQKGGNLTPYNFSGRSNQTKFAHVHLIFMAHILLVLKTMKGGPPNHPITNIKKFQATSMMVPLVTTPREVYIGPLGFFFTPIISRLNVHLSSGCVTCALVNRRPEGRMKRSYFGGFLVKLVPTNVTLVIILFHCLADKYIGKGSQEFFGNLSSYMGQMSEEILTTNFKQCKLEKGKIWLAHNRIQNTYFSFYQTWSL